MGKVRDFLLKIYHPLQDLGALLFPRLHSKIKYKRVTGRKCNLSNPQTLTEKLMYYKLFLYWNNPVVVKCADKFAVREYIKDCGLSQILIPLYGCWDSPDEIDWKALPEQFFLKLNTGSGYNLLCKDKAAFDQALAIRTIKKWWKEKYGLYAAEQGIYQKIKKKVVAEKFLGGPNASLPNDYKFFCSYGAVKIVFVASERSGENTKIDYYTPDWQWINVRRKGRPNNGPIAKPENLEKMLEIASILSKPFPLIRVDLYDIEGAIYFGELTFTHFGCLSVYEPDSYDLAFGQLFPNVMEASDIRL